MRIFTKRVLRRGKHRLEQFGVFVIKDDYLYLENNKYKAVFKLNSIAWNVAYYNLIQYRVKDKVNERREFVDQILRRLDEQLKP